MIKRPRQEKAFRDSGGLGRSIKWHPAASSPNEFVGRKLSSMAANNARSSATGTYTRSKAPSSSTRGLKTAQPGATKLVAVRTGFLIDTLGSQAALARLLQVSTSQPSRWRAGEESPSPEHGRELLDLDHVMARATLLWSAKTALGWLIGANSFLEGARPIDVLRLRGSGEVIAALDAEMAGSYA
jgi:uncharacterized protein (DUF2384 family)